MSALKCRHCPAGELHVGTTIGTKGKDRFRIIPALVCNACRREQAVEASAPPVCRCCYEGRLITDAGLMMTCNACGYEQGVNEDPLPDYVWMTDAQKDAEVADIEDAAYYRSIGGQADPWGSGWGEIAH